MATTSTITTTGPVSSVEATSANLATTTSAFSVSTTNKQPTVEGSNAWVIIGIALGVSVLLATGAIALACYMKRCTSFNVCCLFCSTFFFRMHKKFCIYHTCLSYTLCPVLRYATNHFCDTVLFESTCCVDHEFDSKWIFNYCWLLHFWLVKGLLQRNLLNRWKWIIISHKKYRAAGCLSTTASIALKIFKWRHKIYLIVRFYFEILTLTRAFVWNFVICVKALLIKKNWIKLKIMLFPYCLRCFLTYTFHAAPGAKVNPAACVGGSQASLATGALIDSISSTTPT